MTVKASDGAKVATMQITVTVTDGNDPPHFVSGNSNSTRTMDEGFGGSIGLYLAADPEGDAISWSLQGADAKHFRLSHLFGNDGYYDFLINIDPDFENPADANRDNVFEVTIVISDATGSTSLPMAITVNDWDEAPVITGQAEASFAEGSTSTVAVYSAKDPEGAATTLSLRGTDADSFTLTSGELRFKTPPDFESPTDADTNNRYEVTVKASDGAKVASIQVTVTVTDVSEAAPGIPTNLTVALPSGNLSGSEFTTVTLTLTWDAPIDGDAPSGYQILRRAPATEAKPVILVEDTGSTDTTYADTTAVPSTKYIYRVRAVNARGVSAVSRPFEIFVSPGIPSGLSAQLAAGGASIVLTWDAPADGDAPSGYQILRRAPATEAKLVILVEDTGSADTTYTDTSAISGTKYVYRVSAVNSYGVSMRSKPAEIFFNPVLPGKPSGLSTQLAAGGTSVVLTWDAPTDGSAPSGYQILRRVLELETEFTVVADDTGSTATTYTDTSAAPNTKYVYRVRARNSVGLGPFSLRAFATTTSGY